MEKEEGEDIVNESKRPKKMLKLAGWPFCALRTMRSFFVHRSS